MKTLLEAFINSERKIMFKVEKKESSSDLYYVERTSVGQCWCLKIRS